MKEKAKLAEPTQLSSSARSMHTISGKILLDPSAIVGGFTNHYFNQKESLSLLSLHYISFLANIFHPKSFPCSISSQTESFPLENMSPIPMNLGHAKFCMQIIYSEIFTFPSINQCHSCIVENDKKDLNINGRKPYNIFWSLENISQIIIFT